ncbi:hypothetical protein B0H17DRAFT_1099686 [Mycena rosella]|uniref:Uncharacterized protein n=1 Tax=Mycena rosella TaxID=1033263 RepID=A0AAD7CNA6_MYCRO|nr:hypothetical protein B0H17DRAFT_1099686 [Mycena rosella]
MNTEKYSLERIHFGGCFIRGHAVTITTPSLLVRHSVLEQEDEAGLKRALPVFLRHEGFL